VSDLEQRHKHQNHASGHENKRGCIFEFIGASASFSFNIKKKKEKTYAEFSIPISVFFKPFKDQHI